MNANTKSLRGRKPLTVKFPTGAFTVDQLFSLNSGLVKCELTARNHIKRGLASGKLMKLAEKLVTGTVGAPAFKFQLASYAKKNANRRAKAAAPAVAPAPVAS
jgi:hypothetical protein